MEMRYTGLMKYRLEKDTLGSVEVAADKLWGAQTERALMYFSIGSERMPLDMIYALALIKKIAAMTNLELGILSQKKMRLIVKAADEIITEKLDEHFPLSIWQSGSGTQTNMNVNEVIANRAGRSFIHPNNDVNQSQSTNDVFPTAMHMVSAEKITSALFPSLKILQDALHKKQKPFALIKKIGRTHLQDAVEMTLGEEFSGYVALLDQSKKHIDHALSHLYELPIGGTAVGNGLNAPKNFDKIATKKIAEFMKLPFKPAKNKFALLSAHNAIQITSVALKTLATSLYKIANDIRWLASGPHCGLNELILPANEPGSSIMPGKVNPTQCETIMQVCIQVMANDTAISMANSQGNFELNVCKPLMIYNLLQSIRLLSDSCRSFTKFCIEGISVNKKQLEQNLDASLMNITKLAPKIGYDKAAEIAKYARENNLPLKEALRLFERI